ncbi:MAG: NUDIX domain-containing protein [Patescibacteria group bacterium]|mgnify:FL=1
MSSLERPQVVLVTRSIITDNSNEILLLRRSSDCFHNTGLWEVPGGKLDPGEDLPPAQEREVKEETGLIIKASRRLVAEEHYLIKKGPYEGSLFIGLYGLARVVGGSFRLSAEHDRFSWPSPEAALEFYDLTSGTRNALEVAQDIDR